VGGLTTVLLRPPRTGETVKILFRSS